MRLWCDYGVWLSKKAKRTITGLDADKVESVAVIRHAALGDMILTRPFLIELGTCFPNAQVTLSVVSHYHYGAPEDLVDRVHVVRDSDWHDISIFERFRRLRGLSYHDIIFDLACTSRSLWLCLLNRAGLKVGFPYRTIKRYLYYDAAVQRSDLRFELDDMLGMLRLFGHQSQYPPQFAVPGQASPRFRPAIVYFTGAAVSDKCWPQERFSQLIARMAVIYPEWDHLVLEGVKEWESTAEILRSLHHVTNVHGVAGGSLEDAISLLMSADLVISNDTGIRNLAIGIGTPSLGIFFSTPAFRYWPRFGDHEVVLDRSGALPEVDAVFEAAQALMRRIARDG
jgi:ADP-heptose:LPS heptosyltransferase